MFYTNIKISSIRIFAIIIIFLAISIFLILYRKNIAVFGNNTEIIDINSGGKYIESFELCIDYDSAIVDEIIIPSEFNNIYIDYNKLQKSQGFNLENYKGCSLTRYTFAVLNYPNKQVNVFAEVLSDGKHIVGADMYCTDIDGFIKALK